MILGQSTALTDSAAGALSREPDVNGSTGANASFQQKCSLGQGQERHAWQIDSPCQAAAGPIKKDRRQIFRRRADLEQQEVLPRSAEKRLPDNRIEQVVSVSALGTHETDCAG